MKLRWITRRNRGISMDTLIHELNPILRGWLNYFRLARMNWFLVKLDAWLRRRLRCFKLKQCKRAVGIIRFLRSRGVPDYRIWPLIGAGKGWFRLASAHAAHEAMNLSWFYSLGLFCLTDFYRSNFMETARYGKRMPGGVRGR